MTEHLACDFPGRPVGPSRSEIVDRMRRAFWRARREKGALSALVVVIGNAKSLGARHGDRAPELAASAVAEWLLSAVGDSDVLGFADADRIVVVLPGTDVAGAEEVARHVIANGRTRGVAIGGGAAPVRICAGVANGDQAGVRYVETLVEVAAEGAVVAGAGGGNRCVHTQVYDIVQVQLDRDLPEEARRPPPEEALRAEDHQRDAGATDTPSTHETHGLASSSATEESEFDLALTDDVVRELESGLSNVIESSPNEPGRRMLVDLALTHARRQWEEASARLSAKHSREIELLERRIAKLNEALAGAQEKLGEVEHAGGATPGTASFFRSVQGLSRQEENYELKRELMGMIFEANLELHEQFRRDRTPGSTGTSGVN